MTAPIMPERRSLPLADGEENAMHTPGPWRCTPTQDDEQYTHHVEVIEGRIASIAGW